MGWAIPVPLPTVSTDVTGPPQASIPASLRGTADPAEEPSGSLVSAPAKTTGTVERLGAEI